MIREMGFGASQAVVFTTLSAIYIGGVLAHAAHAKGHYSAGGSVLEFSSVHDQCLAAWETAFRTGNTTELEAFPAPSYQGFFAHAGVTQVEPIDREEAVQGVRLFSRALHGATCRAENRVIRMRSETEAVVTYDRIIEREGKPAATFVVLQAWRLTGGAWRVVREVAEHMG